MGMYYVWKVTVPEGASSPAEVANAVAPRWHADTAAEYAVDGNRTVYFGTCRIHPLSIQEQEERVARAIRKATGGTLEDAIDVTGDPLPQLPERGQPLFDLATNPLGRPAPRKKSKRRGADHRDGYSLMLKVGSITDLIVDVHPDAPRRFFEVRQAGTEGTVGIAYPYAGKTRRFRIRPPDAPAVTVRVFDPRTVAEARIVRPEPGAAIALHAESWADQPIAVELPEVDDKNLLLLFDLSAPTTPLGVCARFEVDGSYVGMKPLAFFDVGATGLHDVLVRYDDEGGDELVVILYLFALELIETVELRPS